MTISSETSKSGPYLGNGSTKIFDYQFKIVDETHLTVIKRDTSGVESTLILNTDYTVADVGQASGGQITLDVAPAVGETITILRNVPFTQETDLENQGAYYAETVEAAFDLMVMRDQQLQEQIDRAVRIPASADPSALDSLVEDIIRLGVSADEIDTVANIADEVIAVAAIDGDVSTVAANLTDVTNFAKVYLGPKSSDPALRNDSSPLQAGDLYFNTAANEMRVYDGEAWRETSAQSLNMNAKSFTGDGLETEFALNVAPAVAANVLVWVGGVRQVPGVDYTVSGTTLTFASAPNGAVDTLVIAMVSELNLAVSYAPQTLTPEQQEQARENIGAISVLDVLMLSGGTMTGGISFGSEYAASVGSLARHIALYGATHGFNVTADYLNYHSVNRHRWLIDGVPQVVLSDGRLTMSSGVGLRLSGDPSHALDAATKQYVDALPITKEYVSAEQSITTTGSFTLSHGLGTKPKIIEFRLVCKTAEGGYAIGDEVRWSGTEYVGGTTTEGPSLVVTSSQIVGKWGNTAPIIVNKTTAANFIVTPANWRLIVRAYA